MPVVLLSLTALTVIVFCVHPGDKSLPLLDEGLSG